VTKMLEREVTPKAFPEWNQSRENFATVVALVDAQLSEYLQLEGYSRGLERAKDLAIDELEQKIRWAARGTWDESDGPRARNEIRRQVKANFSTEWDETDCRKLGREVFDYYMADDEEDDDDEEDEGFL